MRKLYIIGITALSLLAVACNNDKPAFGSKQWAEYLGGPERNHYSTLEQITPANIKQLQVAWQYRTLDSGQIQCNPIIVDSILYGMTATTEPFALNAATGKEIWRVQSEGTDQFSTSRGLSYWKKGDDQRILYTNGPWLYAVNALDGKPITSFGEKGRVSLKAGLGKTAVDKMVISNTPGTVYEDLIVMPLRVSEGTDAALGFIHAFNIVTGKIAWVFHTIPLPGEYGYDTWPPDTYKNTEVGGGNNWSGMSVDRERGILYVPTGSAAYDFYGASRKGTNLFANCLLALDAKTGKRKWHFQLVHHDILDRDPPAPPNLITITRDGKKIDAVAQVTKQGLVFLFDRETGQPLFPIEERKVPPSDIPGEASWPTQPFPVNPAPYARQTFTEADINPLAENRQELLDLFRKSRSEGIFTPLSENGTIIYPGLDGGAEWGGAGVDPEGIMYVNSSEMPWRISIGPSATEEQLVSMTPGESLYRMTCTSCHGAERKGNPQSGFPSLVDIKDRRDKNYVKNIVSHGKGMMPAFPKLTEKQKEALVGFLFDDEKIEEKESGLAKEPGKVKNTYSISGYSKFIDKNGYPAVRPPWGTLNAINLNTGEYVWKVTYGEHPELIAKGIPQTGAESYGGPVVTASGLIFIAGTKDGKFRAYDKITGKLLWETKLPAAGFATPSTYEVNGKQYVVIACGGTKLDSPSGDSYVAFALPDKK
ncbi:outer membrane protein assembly factor BamB family protein [Adhaeribacter pallidiroseus]|uniref:Quinoprotein glucose dehydrogenase (PQQ, quinone) n=1 Tax=Adhaeribacter pallidiroseus TaxID=2072847 RepID=A0A369QAI4_9BACT|nr:PQQ-binding-like beta-propeller repeat protein [Adhaeribacter pallidiroseus]RDC61923.1 Quinoprotein glucose dehydrogenase (PQQ, quinone) [Adhaeribacter pallidiroseus]